MTTEFQGQKLYSYFSQPTFNNFEFSTSTATNFDSLSTLAEFG